MTKTELKEKDKTVPAPDGGCQAWLVVVCSFLCNGIINGITNSFGVLHLHINNVTIVVNESQSNVDMVAMASTQASTISLLGSLQCGTIMLMSPMASILVDRIGIRKTAILGGFIAFLGMFMSSFVGDNVRYILVHTSSMVNTLYFLFRFSYFI